MLNRHTENGRKKLGFRRENSDLTYGLGKIRDYEIVEVKRLSCIWFHILLEKL